MTGAALLFAFFSGVALGVVVALLVVAWVRLWDDTRPGWDDARSLGEVGWETALIEHGTGRAS